MHRVQCRPVGVPPIRARGSPISAWGSPGLGLLELGRGRADAAIPHFEKVARTFPRAGLMGPSVVFTGADHIECLVRTERRAEAEDSLSAFERARTLLCLGERLRRARRRADARVHLRAALEAFDALVAHEGLGADRTPSEAAVS